LSNLLETPDTLEQGIDIRCDLRAALWTVGETGRIRRYLDEAEELARRCDDQQRLGSVSILLSHYFGVTGQLAEARKSALNAQHIGESRGDLAVQVGASFHLGTASFSAGDYQEANGYFRNVIDSLPGELVNARFGMETLRAAASRAWFTWCLAEQGAFEDGIVVGLEGIRIGETVNNAYSLSQAWWALGVLYAMRGEFINATDLLDRSLALARDRNVVVMVPLALWSLGHVHVLSGRVDEGVTLLRQGRDVLEATGAVLLQPLARIHLGEGLLLAHREDEALECAQAALTAARERGHRGYEAWALRLFGDIAASSGPIGIESAQHHYGQAMTLGDELGMRPIVAHCHAGLARLYRRTGNREQAQEHLTTATTMYREMDMRFWLEKAEAEDRAG
jgi:tetratricopeptide (TPR) repeat protein